MDNNIQTKIYKHTNYDDLGRFISYYYQVKYITDLNPESVLEIGVGNKMLVNYMKEHNLPIQTCDIDKNLDPDFIGDIRDLPIESESFDVVCAFQILEHIPFDEVGKALDELYRVSKKYVIISVPYTVVHFEMIIRSTITYRLFKKHKISLFFALEKFSRFWEYNGQHYWEMGKRNYPRKKVRDLLKSKFRIIREKRIDLGYQYFFVLQKK
ncbi:MAG: class I SAM-dependent methyltransferase [Bacteroidetes bacterium]|nr:class I SAM-dependent methyltransferase [Bacteroidota bacterium]